MVQSILSLADRMGGRVVAEGAESEGSVALLMRMGVERFQANLLSGAMSIEALRANGVVAASSHSAFAGTPEAEKPNLGEFEYARREAPVAGSQAIDLSLTSEL